MTICVEDLVAISKKQYEDEGTAFRDQVVHEGLLARKALDDIDVEALEKDLKETARNIHVVKDRGTGMRRFQHVLLNRAPEPAVQQTVWNEVIDPWVRLKLSGGNFDHGFSYAQAGSKLVLTWSTNEF